VEVIKALEYVAHVRDERLILTEQTKEGTGCSDFGGYWHVGQGSDLLRARTASVFVDNEPEVFC